MIERPEVIVALDVSNPEDAWNLVTRLPENTWFKVGLELFTRAGPTVVERLVGEGRHVFLDLKLHDIPNTVAGAVRSIGGLGARLLTVHGAGGEAMLRAAAESAAEANSASGADLRLLAITVLTSLDDAALASVMGPQARVEETAGRLAGLARESGIDGAVCSVNEARAIKMSCGAEFLVSLRAAVWPVRAWMINDASPRRMWHELPVPISLWLVGQLREPRIRLAHWGRFARRYQARTEPFAGSAS